MSDSLNRGRADANEPAFPTYVGDAFNCNPGLTKREYFAAMAMQGMMASAFWADNANFNPEHEERMAIEATRMADALLNALATQEANQ